MKDSNSRGEKEKRGALGERKTVAAAAADEMRKEESIREVRLPSCHGNAKV